MRRWVAACFLLLIAFYLGAAGKDRCGDGPRPQSQVCHLLCADGCATAPLPMVPASPDPAPFPHERHPVEPTGTLVSLDLAPEKDPPRA